MRRFFCFALLLCLFSFGCTKGSDLNRNKGINVAAMKGLTALGLAALMDDGGTLDYTFTLETVLDPVSVGLNNKTIDAAVIPSNAAATLFSKVGIPIKAAAITVESGMYIMERGTNVNGVADLAGKKILSTGQGINPEYILRALLAKSSIETSESNLAFFSTPAEVIAALKRGEGDIALLPKPFTDVAMAQIKGMRYALDMAEEFAACGLGTIVTALLVVRDSYLANNRATFDTFIKEYKQSVEFMTNPENAATAAAYTLELGIVPTQAIADEVFKGETGIAFDDTNLKSKVSSFLGILHEYNPAAIGGKMPKDEFYIL